MKTSILIPTRLSTIACFSLLCMLLATNISYAAGNKAPTKQVPDTAHDSILIRKQKVSRSHRISMYTDAGQKVVFFSVKGHEGKVYQLYVFDMEGKMVKQIEARNNQTSLIKDMEKGIYLFEVFSDDSRIGNGQMTVI